MVRKRLAHVLESGVGEESFVTLQEQRIGDMEGEQEVMETELIRDFGEGCDKNVEEADGDS